MDSLDIRPLEPLDSLEVNITTEELSGAISCMKGGKTPGPDGIPIEIFKLFQDTLIPPMLEMFKEALDTGSLPPSLNMALITLLFLDQGFFY